MKQFKDEKLIKEAVDHISKTAAKHIPKEQAGTLHIKITHTPKVGASETLLERSCEPDENFQWNC